MILEIEDINLVDLPGGQGGKEFEGETLSDFLAYTESKTLDEINKDLIKCGIEPIGLEQIAIVGVRGE